MPVPSSYLTSTKNVPEIMKAIQNGQAPERFTQRFLEKLGYAGNADRLMVNMLKALDFLTDTGQPKERYFKYLDPSEGGVILAEALREAYLDLFQVNTNAQQMTRNELKGKLRAITGGQYSDDVLGKMASTFLTFAGLADWSSGGGSNAGATDESTGEDQQDGGGQSGNDGGGGNGSPLLSGLVYNINIHLPESRDQAVYDALFKSLREHLSQ